MKTQEEVQGLTYKDAADARKRFEAFIDTIYNQQRLHSALDYLTRPIHEPRLVSVHKQQLIDFIV